MKRKNIYVEQYGDFTIYALRTTIWEVYYRLEDFPMIFAFGLSAHEKKDLVFELARANAEHYRGEFVY